MLHSSVHNTQDFNLIIVYVYIRIVVVVSYVYVIRYNSVLNKNATGSYHHPKVTATLAALKKRLGLWGRAITSKLSRIPKNV